MGSESELDSFMVLLRRNMCLKLLVINDWLF